MKKSANSGDREKESAQTHPLGETGASSALVIFETALLDRLQRLEWTGPPAGTGSSPSLEPVDAAAEWAHHHRALDDFSRGNYFEAHEEWEAIWRNRPLESAGRHAFQALIRLCAAGVKRQEGNLRGYAHHLKGAQTHLETALMVPPADAVGWQTWKELFAYLKSLQLPTS